MFFMPAFGLDETKSKLSSVKSYCNAYIQSGLCLFVIGINVMDVIWIMYSGRYAVKDGSNNDNFGRDARGRDRDKEGAFLSRTAQVVVAIVANVMIMDQSHVIQHPVHNYRHHLFTM